MFAGRTRRDRRHRDPNQGCEADRHSSPRPRFRPRDPRPGFRHDLSGRTESEPQHLPFDDDSTGTRLPSGRQRLSRHLHRQRRPQATRPLEIPQCLLMISLLSGLFACSARRDPQSVLDHATQTFRHGNLAAAADEAEKGYKEFHGVSGEWAWKFRILQANSLIWRGLGDRALHLLAAEPSPPTVGDLAVQRIRLESSAYMALDNFSDAEEKLEEAERLCSVSDSESCPTVAFERGGLETARGHFAEGQRLFERTLQLARQRGDRFLEANAFLSLSQSAIGQEHFDEALDWSDSSYRIAKVIDADDLAQNALGNLGWAYYKLGEPDRAEDLFIEAGSRAAHLGDVTDQVKWLTTVGYVYLDAGDFAKAEQCYKQALQMAQQTNKQDVIDSLVSLALVSERTGKLDQARDYADKTIALVPKDGNRLDVLYPMLVQGHVAARQGDTQQAEKIYREIEQDPQSHIFLKWESEHSLAQLYEDKNQPEAADREYRAALNTFEGARAALHEPTSLPFPANAAGIYDDYIRFLVNKRKTIEALQIAEYQRGRTLAEGLGVLQKGGTFRPDDPKAQATARKVGGTILFYWLGEKQSYLWAITPQKAEIFILPAKSEIEPIAQHYRKALAEQQEFLQRTTDDGLALYHTLIEPAAALIPKNAKLFIIPDGGLNTLNFETLLVPGPTPHYWIEDVTLT